MIRASLLVLVAVLATLAGSVSASDTPAVAGLKDVCKTNCDAALHDCSSGCSEEITPDMQFFTVCQTECERTHQYCTAGC